MIFSGLRLPLALAGQLLFTFSVVALSGPGRIDVVDGQARYEVARSLVDHGDPAIRNPDVWWSVHSGRGGMNYTSYRLPQSILGVGAVLLADMTGPVSEARRRFFFSLTGAFCAALLSVLYTIFFLHAGHGYRSALPWGLGGIFLTPAWFYGTSTFDDVLGALVITTAVIIAYMSRRNHQLPGALAAGLLVGAAFNVKPPIAVFVLAVLAAHHDNTLPLRRQAGGLLLIAGGLAAGIAAYFGYEWYKFPPGSAMAGPVEISQSFVGLWPGNVLAGMTGLLASPGAGLMWYFPLIFLSLEGFQAWYLRQKLFTLAFLAASLCFFLFVSSMSLFSGYPAWGPRYLTPLFSLCWLFMPAGIALVRKRLVIGLLLAGFLVQLAALGVDPHRLFVERGIPPGYFSVRPWLHFEPTLSHLLNRPREIGEVLSPRKKKAETFTPSVSPTFAFPIVNFVERGPQAVEKYHLLNSLRPWWISQRYLADDERPVNIGRVAGVLSAAAFIGLCCMILARPRKNTLASRQGIV